ncbi:ead/Ea22-like family protein [Salmonella enterica]|nr:ead/Ea22-like family protein [Salmonella enterica]EGI5187360.1 ead/Ea22-like family protein [Salmonella enterica subsp. enterica serovar Bispebjerg]
MGSNIIELAKLGHERAAELKGSYEAINACSLAQLISDLATQLEVQFVRSTNMAVQLANAESKCRELAAENAYIRNRHNELDLLIGKNILVMQAAIIEWQATGDAKNGLSWIYNTLFGPGELPDESEKDAQAYFDRKYAPIDEELMALHKWFWEQSEAERAAAGIGVKGE